VLCDGLALAELFFASAVVMGFNSSASGFPDARRKPEEEDRGAEKLKGGCGKSSAALEEQHSGAVAGE
jgi:hypothetical protein